MHRLGRPATALAALALLLTLAACGPAPAPAPHLYSFEGGTMGTRYQVKLVVDDPLASAQVERVETAIEAELETVNRSMSTYIDESEISHFNRRVGTEPMALTPPLRDVVTEALAVASASDGAFDVTVGPLIAAWGFGSDADELPQPPDADTLTALLESIGSDKLIYDADAGTLAKVDADIAIDLSGIAKGYAVDRVADALEAEGYADFMVEVGGEIRTRGHNRTGRPWRIGIEEPSISALPGTNAVRLVDLSDLAMATSGDYRNYRETADGRRIAHIIDPRSGQPIAHRVASVTVIDPRCLRADAWATALIVLGLDDGLRRAEANELAALFLVRGDDGFSAHTTSAFQQLLRDAADAAPSPAPTTES
ncbi:MAG: FAD:protein FMN transferase [Acidobacteriota bacterium]